MAELKEHRGHNSVDPVRSLLAFFRRLPKMTKTKVTLLNNRKEMEKVIIEKVLIVFRCFLRVLIEEEDPPYVSLYLNSSCLRFLGLWPPQHNKESRPSRMSFAMIMVMEMIFMSTIAAHLPRSANFIEFGDDLVLLLGTVMVNAKMLIFRWHYKEITRTIFKLNLLHVRFAQLEVDNRRVRRLQRLFFLVEVFIFMVYLVLVCFLAFAMVSQPLFADQNLPYRVLFPFAFHDPQRQPIAFTLIYVFQVVCVTFNLFSIVALDGTAVHIMAQTTLNLRILCVRIRNLGQNDVCGGMWDDLREIVKDHQGLIELIDEVNDAFAINYLVQMACSTFMICLTAFELLMTMDQLLVAFKFQLYMLLAFMQLFYWCCLGNMVYFDSLEIADAAFGVQNWFTESPRFQRNLMFFIMRAQKPLVFRAPHFRPFDFQTFTWLMSSSYTYLALLRTVHD